MKKKEKSCIKTTVICIVAGLAAIQFIREIPAMVRYAKMKRL